MLSFPIQPWSNDDDDGLADHQGEEEEEEERKRLEELSQGRSRPVRGVDVLGMCFPSLSFPQKIEKNACIRCPVYTGTHMYRFPPHLHLHGGHRHRMGPHVTVSE